jgi:predicted Zn-dependent protease
MSPEAVYMLLRRLPVVATLAVGALLSGCATNPVTGRPDVVTISEEKEIEIGRELHPKVLQQYGR